MLQRQELFKQPNLHGGRKVAWGAGGSRETQHGHGGAAGTYLRSFGKAEKRWRSDSGAATAGPPAGCSWARGSARQEKKGHSLRGGTDVSTKERAQASWFGVCNCTSRAEWAGVTVHMQ